MPLATNPKGVTLPHALSPNARTRVEPAPLKRLAYTPAEVAELLGCTRQHVHALIARGQLRSAKIGASRRITTSALAELLGEADDAPS